MTGSALGSFGDPATTAAHYAAKLAVETDASDVWTARQAGELASAAGSKHTSPKPT